MRSPAFWDGPSLLSDILMPLGDLYAAGGWLRQRLATPKRVGVPVICVGNLVAGGAARPRQCWLSWRGCVPRVGSRQL